MFKIIMEIKKSCFARDDYTNESKIKDFSFNPVSQGSTKLKGGFKKQ